MVHYSFYDEIQHILYIFWCIPIFLLTFTYIQNIENTCTYINRDFKIRVQLQTIASLNNI